MLYSELIKRKDIRKHNYINFNGPMHEPCLFIFIFLMGFFLYFYLNGINVLKVYTFA